MTDENNKIYELIQQENRWNRITNLGQTALMLIPTFILIYKSFQKQKLSPKQRLMRNRAAQARLKLDEQLILEEALHETELKKMETGLDNTNKKEDEPDFLTNLKQKGQNLLKDKINQVNKVVDDKLEQATDKLKVDKDKKE